MAQVPQITISIVSHRQAHLVLQLLTDIDRYCGPEIEVILTMNIQEEQPIDTGQYLHNIKLISNTSPKGFGANHNSAFALANGRYFCVMNPDVRFSANPFTGLLECLSNSHVGIAAPLVLGADGSIEDSARRFPTPIQILAKIVRRARLPDYATDKGSVSPDWVAGMFMLFPAAVFRKMGGFDARYYLYYEDVDLCARLKLAGYEIAVCPKVQIVHDARRQSHRDWKYLRWHLRSMMRFFLSKPFFAIVWRRMVAASSSD
jgi:N-acetylglucosaminyl-diphospho-decaprenol L-rhamnosyltransferase